MISAEQGYSLLREDGDSALGLDQEAFLETIREDWPEAKAFLKDLVEENSFTLNPDGVRKNSETIIRQFASFNFSTRVLPSTLDGAGEHLILDSGGEGVPVLLVSHLDTVYPPEEQAAAYLGWDDLNDRIEGPGTYDIKGGTVAMWLMLRCLHQHRPDLFARHRWILAWNAAEERLCEDFSSAVLALLPSEPLACLVFEGDNRSQDGHEVLCGRSGIARFRLCVHGKSAHSGNSHSAGVNAIVRIAELVGRIAGLTDYERFTTVNVGVIRGGLTTNRVPDRAEILFEVRYRDRAHFEEIQSTLHALQHVGSTDHPGASVVLETLQEIPAWVESPGTLALARFWQDAGQICGHPVTLGIRSGLSDANFFSPHVRTLDGLGPRGGNSHSVVNEGGRPRITEFVDQNSFLTKSLINALGLANLLASPKGDGRPTT